MQENGSDSKAVQAPLLAGLPTNARQLVRARRRTEYFPTLSGALTPVNIDKRQGQAQRNGYEMQKNTKVSCQKHLSTINDEICGLSRMVDEDRYSIDIVRQISAVRDGLRRVSDELLRDHVSHCVEHAIASGDKSDQRLKIKELISLTTTDMSGVWP